MRVPWPWVASSSSSPPPGCHAGSPVVSNTTSNYARFTVTPPVLPPTSAQLAITYKAYVTLLTQSFQAYDTPQTRIWVNGVLQGGSRLLRDSAPFVGRGAQVVGAWAAGAPPWEVPGLWCVCS